MCEEYACPHCGSTKGTWFDRSVIYDAQGNPLEYEEFPNRCESCGRNVDAPTSYYVRESQSSESCEKN